MLSQAAELGVLAVEECEVLMTVLGQTCISCYPAHACAARGKVIGRGWWCL